MKVIAHSSLEQKAAMHLHNGALNVVGGLVKLLDRHSRLKK